MSSLRPSTPPSPRSVPYLLPAPPTISNPPQVLASRLTLLSDPLHPHRAYELGRGAFGVVYAALLDSIIPVAVKAARGAPPSRDARERHIRIAARQFKREVRRYLILSTAPSVPRFHGVARLHTNPPVLALVTEHIQGNSLDKLNLKNLNKTSIISISKKLVMAVADLHRRNMSHGDLKPGNIMLSQQIKDDIVMNDIRIYLVDFGLSRVFGHTNKKNNKKKQVKVKVKDDDDDDDDTDVECAAVNALWDEVARGTPAYLAPEAWSGDEALNEKEIALAADVFALAMILYELECDKKPWQSYGRWEVFDYVCMQGARPEWPETNEKIPGMRRLIERCWTQESENRPQCVEIARDLSEIENGLISQEEEATTITNHNTDIFSASENTTRTTPTNQSTWPVEVVQEPLSNISQITWETSKRDSIVPSEQNSPLITYPHRPTNTMSISQQPTTSNPSPFPTMETVPHSSPSPLPSLPQSHPPPPPPPPPPPLPQSQNALHNNIQQQPSFQSNESNTFIPVSNQTSHPAITTIDTDSADEITPNPHPAMPKVPFVLVQSPQPSASTLPSLDYPYRAQVQSNDVNGLCNAFILNNQDLTISVQLLEAISVIAQGNGPNCEQIARKGLLRTLVTISVRFGANDPRLCKAACVLLSYLAQARRMSIDKELRIAGTPEIVINCIQWHPSSIPVILNACCALRAMCRSSRALRDIALSLHGHETAARCLEKAAFTFQGDVGIATAASSLLEVIAQYSPQSILENDVLLRVVRATTKMATFQIDPKSIREIDEKAIVLMDQAVRIQPEGRNKLWQVKGCILALENILFRAFNGKYPNITLARGCKIVSELGQMEPLQDTARIFLGSDIISVVIACLSSLQIITSEHDILLALYGIECLRIMTGLGKDVCGSLQALMAYSVVKEVIDKKPNNRQIAYQAALFFVSILRETKESQATSSLETIFQALLQLQGKWNHEPHIANRTMEGISIIKESPLPPGSSASSMQESIDMVPSSRKANGHGKFGRLLPRRR